MTESHSGSIPMPRPHPAVAGAATAGGAGAACEVLLLADRGVGGSRAFFGNWRVAVVAGGGDVPAAEVWAAPVAFGDPGAGARYDLAMAGDRPDLGPGAAAFAWTPVTAGMPDRLAEAFGLAAGRLREEGWTPDGRGGGGFVRERAA